MTPRDVRKDAALELVTRGELHPLTALSIVVWPPKSLTDERVSGRRRKEWPPEVREQARRLYDQGHSREAVGALLGVPPTTIKCWVMQPGRTGASRRNLYDRSLIATRQ